MYSVLLNVTFFLLFICYEYLFLHFFLIVSSRHVPEFSLSFLRRVLFSGTSFSAGLVSEPENEGQAAETLPALASPLHRSTGGSSHEPCFLVLHPDVPIHPAPTAPPPSSPLRPHGSVLHSAVGSQLLRRAAEAAGSPPPVPVPRQTRGAGSLLLLSQHAAPPPLMPLLPLPPLGARTAFQRQSRGAEPPQESKDQKAIGFSGAKRGDGLKSEQKSKHETKTVFHYISSFSQQPSASSGEHGSSLINKQHS